MTSKAIDAIISNLEISRVLLENMDNDQYTNDKIGPYYSSIGAHLRHILDIFDCVLDGVPTLKADLTARKRNEIVESNLEKGMEYLDSIMDRLDEIRGADINTLVEVSDDWGLGMLTFNYTLGAALGQAHSHAIHHYASMGYMLDLMGIEIPHPRFGFNPTTPERELH